MKTITEPDLVRLSGASHTDILNWRGRLELATKYEKTVSGRARQFSRENALEIRLMNRLIKNGMAPAAAAKVINEFFAQLKAKKPLGWAIFILDERFPVNMMCSDEPPSEELLRKLGDCYVVNVAEHKNMVDAFFDQEAEQ